VNKKESVASPQSFDHLKSLLCARLRRCLPCILYFSQHHRQKLIIWTLDFLGVKYISNELSEWIFCLFSAVPAIECDGCGS
jgi:hypothetical protein